MDCVRHPELALCNGQRTERLIPSREFCLAWRVTMGTARKGLGRLLSQLELRGLIRLALASCVASILFVRADQTVGSCWDGRH